MTGAASGVAAERAKLRAIRDDIAGALPDRASFAWDILPIETRCVLILVSGIDTPGELSDLARRAWREFTPAEQAAIRSGGGALRWQLNGSRALFGAAV